MLDVISLLNRDWTVTFHAISVLREGEYPCLIFVLRSRSLQMASAVRVHPITKFGQVSSGHFSMRNAPYRQARRSKTMHDANNSINKNIPVFGGDHLDGPMSRDHRATIRATDDGDDDGDTTRVRRRGG